MKTKRAFKYRFYPTPEQESLLAQTFGCVRFVYNTILAWRVEAYRSEQKRIGYAAASAQLTALKKTPERAFLNEVSSVPLQQCLRHQQKAFQAFFEKRASYPAFKSKKQRQSAEFTASAFQYRGGQLFLAKCKEPLPIRWTKQRETLPSTPSTVTVTRDTAGRYFVSLLCEVEAQPLPVSPQTTGIDLGLKALFVTAEGERIDNPRHTAKYAARLAKAQRALCRKQRGSKNRAKARQKVARLHAKIADTRLDGLHQLSRRLIDENQVVCVESLAVKNLIRNRALSKSIADAGWGELVRQLEYKAAWAGRQLVRLDRWFPSSKRCSCCGHTLASLPLKVRDWTCPACATEHDRDLNAAVNIKAAGLAVLALGENVSGIGRVPLS
ncbi:RNA-guided endonuclease TnpB family protein [Azotobacter beijerinckii]|uniref:Transposase, IS605 OrfB family, central region n=1 Tax=Azotobacter beijerinckii TaxID=170623 RepID=A0A1I4F761_9GAMM|nr:RNA-guided endonuclease TnpB family protein [Azotobacter beijerinckii]SFB45752.1 transposase, IS605 OrfB family, central region [Azotobacter beijerinckii]SFL12241.1 transposase, IS605 OrfB family, central region [Azotobacter beijerinckii]